MASDLQQTPFVKQLASSGMCDVFSLCGSSFCHCFYYQALRELLRGQKSCIKKLKAGIWNLPQSKRVIVMSCHVNRLVDAVLFPCLGYYIL